VRVIKISRIFLILSAALVLFTSGRAAEVKRPSREYKVYFENTPNELGVYRLYGRFDGKTIFILGGIQGDERVVICQPICIPIWCWRREI
jgi:hypothetical protein